MEGHQLVSAAMITAHFMKITAVTNQKHNKNQKKVYTDLQGYLRVCLRHDVLFL